MNKKDIGLLLPALTMVVVLAGYLLSANMLLQPVFENQAKLKAIDADISAAQTKLDSISVADKTMLQFSDTVNSLLLAVPDSVDAPNLITEVESIAKKSAVDLASIAPPAEIASGAVSQSAGYSSSVAISGSFKGIYQFISSLETSIRYCKIKSITISAGEGGLTASIAFDVYRRPAVSIPATETTSSTQNTESGTQNTDQAPVEPEIGQTENF